MRFNLTFGLGGMAALLIVVQFVTGFILKFHYEPAPQHAYDSILTIQQAVPFGQLLRNMHHWSAVLLVWITFLHLLRVVFTGAFYPPRHITWIFGVVLLLLVLLSNFTGYLLPWDQLSYWAITISSNLLEYIPLIGQPLKTYVLSGDALNHHTLANFYHLHTGIFPIAFILLMAWHFWRVRVAGGVILSNKGLKTETVPTNPYLVAREGVVALVLIALLLLLSILFNAPLIERANPLESPNPAKAPWYFMGFQELLIHFNPTVAIAIIPLIVLVLSLWIPYSKKTGAVPGVWFSTHNGKKTTIITFVVTIVSLVVFILLSGWLPDPERLLPAIPGFVTMGLIPLLVLVGLLYLYINTLHKRYKLSFFEKIQVVVVFLSTAYLILTITGIFFRGENMQLVWPWQI